MSGRNESHKILDHFREKGWPYLTKGETLSLNTILYSMKRKIHKLSLPLKKVFSHCTVDFCNGI